MRIAIVGEAVTDSVRLNRCRRLSLLFGRSPTLKNMTLWEAVKKYVFPVGGGGVATAELRGQYRTMHHSGLF